MTDCARFSLISALLYPQFPFLQHARDLVRSLKIFSVQVNFKSEEVKGYEVGVAVSWVTVCRLASGCGGRCVPQVAKNRRRDTLSAGWVAA